MKETIAFSQFDAELNTDCCDAYNNAELTLTLKLGFKQINPAGTAATGTHNDYGDPTDTRRTIVRWTPAAWTTWKEQFRSTAEAFWNGKFWLVNDAGLFSYTSGGVVYVPNVYCKIKIEASDGAAGNHHTIDVVRMPNTSAWFGSHSTLYDSNDIRPQASGTDSRGRTLMQRAHVHEVGHLLGLGHVDIGQPHCPASGNTNVTACYGVSDHSMNSVMGAGMRLRPENAEPWRNAIRGFALTATRRQGLAATVTGSPISRVFAFPTHLFASWPAKMTRHYPRTVDEALRDVLITSRIGRVAA